MLVGPTNVRQSLKLFRVYLISNLIYVFIFWIWFSIRDLGNLRICVDHPLNSSIGIIIHQECVKSIRYQDSLECITLENNKNVETLRILIFWTRSKYFLIDVFLPWMQQVKLIHYVILHDSYVQSSLLGW